MHIEVNSDRAEFILDSPLASIEFTEAVPSDVSYRDSQIISFGEDNSYRSVNELINTKYFRTEMRFTIVHPEGSPLDFSVGRGKYMLDRGKRCFAFRVKILNWEEVVTESTNPAPYIFRSFRDVLSLVPHDLTLRAGFPRRKAETHATAFQEFRKAMYGQDSHQDAILKPKN